MSGAKEIRTKIKSIRNTQKITSAMEKVAASKMRKTQERMEAARPYAERIRRVIAHLRQARPAQHFQHPYLTPRRDTKRVGCIVISTDRGLCGGLNANLFRAILQRAAEFQEQGIDFDLSLIGSKAVSFFTRFNARILSQVTNLGDVPRVTDLVGPIQAMLDDWAAGDIDELYLAYNQFINRMSQRPVITRLAPAEIMEEEQLQDHWDYIYEPNSVELLEVIANRYIESQVYRAVLDNIASEQAARMVAMKAATDNAGELIETLELVYNKARQAAITQEISEIVGGAAAV